MWNCIPVFFLFPSICCCSFFLRRPNYVLVALTATSVAISTFIWRIWCQPVVASTLLNGTRPEYFLSIFFTWIFRVIFALFDCLTTFPDSWDLIMWNMCIYTIVYSMHKLVNEWWKCAPSTTNDTRKNNTIFYSTVSYIRLYEIIHCVIINIIIYDVHVHVHA